MHRGRYAWEEGFRAKIEAVRAEELRLLRRYRSFRIVAEVMWSAVPALVSLSSFAAFTLLAEGTLTPAKAFTSLALFNILRFPLAVTRPRIIIYIECIYTQTFEWECACT
jgi:hypothetical protein